MINIIKSRFKKSKEDFNVKNRRKECSKCEFNSINTTNYSVFKKVLKKLSDFYSLITFRIKEDTLGNCTACNSCSIFFKTEEKIEKCPKNKWKEWN